MDGRLNLRRLWQPPGRYADRAADRRVTFLELFFDLVFVVVISQLGHHLATHPSWAGVGWFVFLFYAVWSSWLNGTLYYDLHTTNDVGVRVFTFAQMLTVAVMGAFIGDVPGEGTDGFALAYAANTLLLVILWFRTGLHDPAHRPGSVPYSIGYLVAAVLFAVSVAFEGSTTYWLWAIALASEVLGFVIGMHRWTPPETQGGDAIIATTPSLIERMGLFVIIVLGEVIVGAVAGMADLDPLDATGIVIGLLGVIVAIGLWWIYFDLVSHREPVPRHTQLWLYLHFPLVVAIAAGGAGVLNTIGHEANAVPDEVRWLLAGALAAALVTIALITATLRVRTESPELYRTVDIVLIVCAVLCLGVGLTDWGAKGTLTAMAMLLLAPIAVGILVWLKHTEPDTVELG
ncbi:MAG TPA: low temperature requirement protein A [Actinomycetota bacterium]|nr:low temperature requirement protein A [Actinomycetota bacterium]